MFRMDKSDFMAIKYTDQTAVYIENCQALNVQILSSCPVCCFVNRKLIHNYFDN